MEYAIGIIILLGILIFIHEFGHFYAAKLCGMKVEVFSIGMGKKILKFTRGETEYTLSIFPFGGYVKILGQDPREEISNEDRERSFSTKPLWQRTVVVLAGPISNAVLAIFIFSVIYSTGIESPAPVLSFVRPNTPAAIAGFESGDQVLSINTLDGTKTEIQELSSLSRYLKGKEGTSLVFEVANPNHGNVLRKISYTPTIADTTDFSTGINREQATLVGVEYQKAAALLSITKNTWSDKHDLPSLIFVESISLNNGEIVKINSYEQLMNWWSNNFASATESGSILIDYKKMNDNLDGLNEEPLKKTISWNSLADAPPAQFKEAGFYDTQLMISSVVPASPAEKLGLKLGDYITSVDNQEIISFEHFRTLIQQLSTTKESFTISWLREGNKMEALIEPHNVETEDPITMIKKNKFQIGASFLAIKAPFDMAIVKADSFIDAVSMGWSKSMQMSGTIVNSFWDLISGQVSFKAMGGPIMIGKIAGDSLKSGWDQFFRMMAFISLNLFIFNLLPLPVLDGGHLLLFAIEGLFRRPLPIKIIEIWTMTGFVFLMGLVLLVTINDFSRIGLFNIFK